MEGEGVKLVKNPTAKEEMMLCKPKHVRRPTYPDQVLVGTDLRRFNEFKATHVRTLTAKADIGGVEISIDIQADENRYYKASRTIREPGLEPATNSFEKLCKDGSMLVGSDLVILFTKRGVLWLEEASTRMTMPKELWVAIEK